MAARPFTIDVPDAVLDDLRRRLEQTRWPDEIPGTAWDYGSNLGYMKELVEYWRTRFDWRAQERYLNSLPHFKAQVDGLGIHFIHLKGKGPAPLPLIVTHGWPGSFFEMYKIAGPLTDPASHGGDPADAFDLVVPSLPGYGFSDMPKERGIGVGRTAELWTKLMTDVLGYPRFGAQGGDWGAAVTTALGYLSPKNVVGIHVNMVLGRAVGDPVGEMSPAEQQWREEMAAWRANESAYAQLQGTKPQTLAYGLNDSPAGLAAWIVEKWRTWSDCGGDVESVYTKDELLTNVMIYWATGTINSSVRYYYENGHTPPPVPRDKRVEVPVAVAAFPKELMRPPREVAERIYNIQRWTEMPRGGHFAAMEQPDLLVEDVRAFFKTLR